MLGIVIVTHNSARVLAKCLESCRKLTEATVVVVDNASRDESVQVAQAAGVIVCANGVVIWKVIPAAVSDDAKVFCKKCDLGCPGAIVFHASVDED